MNNFEEGSCNLRSMIETVCGYFGIEKPTIKQGAPAKANESDLIVIVKAMSCMLDKLRKEKDETINELKSEIKILNDKVKSLEEKSNEEKQNINEISKPLFSEIVSRPTANEINLIAKIDREQREIKNKERNIIAFGIPKSSENDQDSSKKDQETIRGIFKELNVDDKAIKQIRRMNTKNQNKPNPIIIELKEEFNRKNILKVAKKLKDSTMFASIYLAPDLTITQREVQKSLIEERNRRNEQLTNNGGDESENFYYGIRNGKIAKIRK